MEERRRISVALAAYNGETYIKEQIKSILPQLTDEDELVISLDPSTDRTAEIILSFSDRRIRLIDGPGKGVLRNFENAVSHCLGDYIFLSDQDDIWMRDKVKEVLTAFSQTGAMLVLHDAVITDGSMEQVKESFFAWKGTRTGLWRNLLKNSYIGCCMAFRAELLRHILPFPQKIPMHDQWIGLQAERHGGSMLLPKPLLKYRRHGANVSGDTHASPFTMILWRLQMLKALLSRKT